MRYLLAAALLAYLPFLGVVIGGSAASLFLNFLWRENREEFTLRLSGEMIETVAGNKILLSSAGLLPLPLLAFIWLRILSDPGALPLYYWALPFGALLSGCGLLSVYGSETAGTKEASTRCFMAGAAGLFSLIAASFLVFILVGALFDPENIPLIRKNAVYILSWKSFTGFLLFLALSFGLTGGIVLLLPALNADRQAEPDPGYREYVRRAGSGMALGGALAAPACVIMGILSVPPAGLSQEVFAACAATLVLAMAAALALVLVPGIRTGKTRAFAAVVFVLMFASVLFGDQAAIGNAFLGRKAPGVPAAAAAVPAAAKHPEVIPEAAPGAERGKVVFEKSCRACHLFETAIVGPPMREVRSKYRGDLEGLKNYVRKPVRVNPAYPSMPHLGLKDEDLDAVARYLLSGAPGEPAPEAPAAAKPAAGDKGKEVFDRICSACHLFDSRVVGPPLNDAVPRYKGDLEKLKRFIENPAKVDPEYPAMPKLGLSPEEIDAVARYLISKTGRGG